MAPPPHTQMKRFTAYLEPDLYEWVHQQAALQRRSGSSWAAYVFAQLREGLQPGAPPVTLGGGKHE